MRAWAGPQPQLSSLEIAIINFYQHTVCARLCCNQMTHKRMRETKRGPACVLSILHAAASAPSGPRHKVPACWSGSGSAPPTALPATKDTRFACCYCRRRCRRRRGGSMTAPPTAEQRRAQGHVSRGCRQRERRRRRLRRLGPFRIARKSLVVGRGGVASAAHSRWWRRQRGWRRRRVQCRG